MRQSALVLLGLPDDAVGADGLEFVPFGEKDAEVEVVAHVDPDDDEEAEVGADEGMVDVVQGLRSLPDFSIVTCQNREGSLRRGRNPRYRG